MSHERTNMWMVFSNELTIPLNWEVTPGNQEFHHSRYCYASLCQRINKQQEVSKINITIALLFFNMQLLNLFHSHSLESIHRTEVWKYAIKLKSTEVPE